MNALQSLAMMATALLGLATTTTPVVTPPHIILTTKIGTAGCVGTAVVAREEALDTAMTTLTTVENGAYAARETALASAYAQTTNASIASSIKTAWSTFNTTTKNARAQWSTARTAAWSTFATSAKACKTTMVPLDTSNSTSDLSGT